jgi:hypothetical protein
MTHFKKSMLYSGGALLLVVVIIAMIGHRCVYGSWLPVANQNKEEVRVAESSKVRVLPATEFVTFKMPDGWAETARFVDPENGNTIYLRNGRMIVVPKNGMKALADTDPDD